MATGSTPEARLAALGFTVPEDENPPAATYVRAVPIGNILFVSGHGPFKDGEYIYKGKLGRDLDVPTGQEAARLTILNLLAAVKAHVGELSHVKRIAKLLVLVNSDPEFVEQHLVANGASDLLVEAFGPQVGPHARSAIGVPTLPMGISVEIEGIFEV
jgi:enamine deaminase RidA (YjgF/YER057c/UK114 family)